MRGKQRSQHPPGPAAGDGPAPRPSRAALRPGLGTARGLGPAWLGLGVAPGTRVGSFSAGLFAELVLPSSPSLCVQRHLISTLF